eukprot:4975441-Lingulodinium_polyedra.AAC.1
MEGHGRTTARTLAHATAPADLRARACHANRSSKNTMRHPAPRVVGHMIQKSAARSRGRSWVCVCVCARALRDRGT